MHRSMRSIKTSGDITVNARSLARHGPLPFFQHWFPDGAYGQCLHLGPFLVQQGPSSPRPHFLPRKDCNAGPWEPGAFPPPVPLLAPSVPRIKSGAPHSFLCHDAPWPPILPRKDHFPEVAD